jgi:hypothetical protein
MRSFAQRRDAGHDDADPGDFRGGHRFMKQED